MCTLEVSYVILDFYVIFECLKNVVYVVDL